MKIMTRGSDVVLEASGFLDNAGATVVPTSVSFRMDYPGANRCRKQATVTGANTATDEWTGTWDSSVAYSGTVFVSVLVGANNTIVDDGQFQLTANQANPDPT